MYSLGRLPRELPGAPSETATATAGLGDKADADVVTFLDGMDKLFQESKTKTVSPFLTAPKNRKMERVGLADGLDVGQVAVVVFWEGNRIELGFLYCEHRQELWCTWTIIVRPPKDEMKDGTKDGTKDERRDGTKDDYCIRSSCVEKKKPPHRYFVRDRKPASSSAKMPS